MKREKKNPNFIHFLYSTALSYSWLSLHNRQGRQGGRVALCTALAVRDNVPESLWMTIRVMEHKGDFEVGAYYYWSPRQDGSTDELFYRQLGEMSGSVAHVLMGHTILLRQASLGKSWSFLKYSSTQVHKCSGSQLGKMPSKMCHLWIEDSWDLWW